MATAETKQTRLCIGCGQEDDHPRHTGTNEPWHLDCHAMKGCALCKAQLETANGAQGDDLQQHLISIRQES